MALEPTIDPSEVGIDPARLARIDEVTHAYVDDGRFPFVQLVVRRRVRRAGAFGRDLPQNPWFRWPA